MKPLSHEKRGVRASLAWILTGLLVVVLAQPAAAIDNPFADIDGNTQFYDEILWMYENGITTGYPCESDPALLCFDDQGPVRREAMAAFLWRYEGQPAVSLPSEPPFTDLDQNSAFYPQIVWMYQEGLSKGTPVDPTDPNTLYRYDPADPSIREAAAAFLYRLANPQGYVPPATTPFTDVATDYPFYKEIAWCYEKGITTETTFDPHGEMTRGAMAAFLYRFDSVVNQT